MGAEGTCLGRFEGNFALWLSHLCSEQQLCFRAVFHSLSSPSVYHVQVGFCSKCLHFFYQFHPKSIYSASNSSTSLASLFIHFFPYSIMGRNYPEKRIINFLLLKIEASSLWHHSVVPGGSTSEILTLSPCPLLQPHCFHFSSFVYSFIHASIDLVFRCEMCSTCYTPWEGLRMVQTCLIQPLPTKALDFHLDSPTASSAVSSTNFLPTHFTPPPALPPTHNSLPTHISFTRVWTDTHI